MTDDIIVRLAARGDGMTATGRHIAFTAPGDRVGGDGTILPGPHHATPPCRHFGRCGGCRLQHVDDAAYADFLIERIRGALAAQGVPVPAIRTPHLSPAKARRRAGLRAERKGRVLRIGFNEMASHRLVDLAECPVLHDRLFTLIDPLRALLARLLPDRAAAGIALTLADQGVDLLLSNVVADGLETAEVLTRFAEAHALARLAVDDGYGPQTRWEPDAVTITLGGVAVPLPHGAFLQATVDGEAALVASVREAVGGSNITADLFAGLGTFALSLAGRIYAAEGARDAVLALKSAAARAQRPIFVEHRDLFRRPLDARELGRFEAVVLDPPRAGAKEQMPALAQADVARLAYISCNPATFARDAKMLMEGGWRLDWIRPVGQFRWSTHVELAAAFSR